MAQNPISSATVTMAAGSAVSAGFNTGTSQVAAIVIPSNWSPVANISFLVSLDNITYYEVFDTKGKEIVITADAGTCVMLDPADAAWMTAVGWIQIRSGSKKFPIPQTNNVTLTAFLRS